jgi:ABC-type Co2+ transport system permease subunit
MWPITGAVVLVVLMTALQLPALKRDRQYREMITYLLVAMGSLALFSAQSLNIPLPNPLGWIAGIYRFLGLVLGK